MPANSTPLGGDVPLASRFLLEVDGVEIGVFSEVQGLELRVPVEEYAEGGVNGYSHKLPGRMEWPHLVFRRGITDSDALFDWVRKTSGDGFAAGGNKVVRSTAAITVIGDGDKRLRSWELEGVFAVRWTGPRFSIDDASALEEELELAHHGFVSRTQP